MKQINDIDAESGVIHLDSEISCQLPCVSVIFFLLKLNLMIICLLWRRACHYKTCSRAVWILLCHILTLLSSSTRLSSTKSTTLSSPILTTQGICENRFKTIKTLPLLSQPEAFIRNFGWFCCLAEHVLEFIFHLNYTIRNGYDRNPFPPLRAYSFHLPTGEFHFPLLLSKIQSPLKKQYPLIVKLLETFVFRSAKTREQKFGGMFYCLLPIRSLSLWSTFSCLASVSASSFSIISAASARFLADFWNIRSALAKKSRYFNKNSN